MCFFPPFCFDFITKVIKNNKDFFDQSMDEIKMLQYINSHCEPDEQHVLRLIGMYIVNILKILFLLLYVYTQS